MKILIAFVAGLVVAAIWARVALVRWDIIEQQETPTNRRNEMTTTKNDITSTIKNGDKVIWQRLTKRAVDLGWTCAKCGCSNIESDLLCGFCDTPRPSH